MESALLLKDPVLLGLVVHTCNSRLGELRQEGRLIGGQLGYMKTLSQNTCMHTYTYTSVIKAK